MLVIAENLAYGAWSDQSTTDLNMSSQLAVDGFLYTCTLTQLPPSKVSMIFQ